MCEKEICFCSRNYKIVHNVNLKLLNDLLIHSHPLYTKELQSYCDHQVDTLSYLYKRREIEYHQQINAIKFTFASCVELIS